MLVSTLYAFLAQPTDDSMTISSNMCFNRWVRGDPSLSFRIARVLVNLLNFGEGDIYGLVQILV